MKKLILTIIMVILASAGLCSQTKTTWLETYKSDVMKNKHDIKDIDRITFQKVTGNPKCDITIKQPIINKASIGQQFYVTVAYNKKMNIESTKPDIKFSAGSTSLVKNDTLSLWLDDSTYYAAFNIVDKDQQFVIPKITVKGARDIYANEQDSCVLSDAFILDTRMPDTAKVEFPSYLKICDDAVGEKYSIKFTFTEKMKNRPPSVAITPQLAANTFTQYTGKWTSDKEFTATYLIADDGYDGAVTFTISNAQDSAGNKITLTPAGKTVAVDTRNPKVSTIGATKTNLNLNDVGSIITITVSFSDPIKEPPDLTFSPNIIGKSLKFNGPPQPTAFPSRWEYKYEVIQAVTENFIDVDVIVKDAKDSCGNLSVEYTKQDYINVLFLITKVIEENFDSYLKGGPPPTPPWERLLPEGKGNKVQSGSRYSLENALELEGQQTPTVLNERALQQFSATPDEINLEIYVMADALTDSGGIALINKNTKANFASMTYCTDGKVKIQSGASAPVTADFSGADNPYAATVWALIRLQYNKNGDLTFYVNNAKITTINGTLPTGTFDSIMLFSSQGKMYFDDILLWHQ